MKTERKSERAEEYLNFMNNINNEFNCEECPENIGSSSWPGTRRPCGQFNC